MRSAMLWGIVAALALCLPAACAKDMQLTLARTGKPTSTIVMAKTPTRSAQMAARELQWHVLKITGALLPIVTDDAKVKGVRILIGESKATQKLGLQNNKFGLREYLIDFRSDTLILMGHDAEDRGKLNYTDDWFDQPNLGEHWDELSYKTFPNVYSEHASCLAVYDFLERYCDVRWYRPGEIGMVYTQRKTLTVRGATMRRTPDFRYIGCEFYEHSQNIERTIGLWPSDGGFPDRGEKARAVEELSYPDLQARYYRDPNFNWTKYIEARRREGYLFLLRRRTGGQPFRANHSLVGYYDRFWQKNPEHPERFEVEHNDWFAQGYQGKPPQLCYTHPDVIKQVVQEARDYFDGKGLKYGAVGFGDFFAVVPMDNGDYCRCPRCRAWINPDQSGNGQFNNGKWSGYIFNFVNEVAKEVRKTHPDKYIATLAYAEYAYYPTRVTLEPNIAVQMCLHNRNWWSPAMEENDIKMLKEWAGKEKDRPLYLWLYYGFPQENSNSGQWYCFPGFFGRTIARQTQLFKEYGVRGVFYCGMPQDVDFYLSLKMFDDATVDVKQVLDEYFTRYYGAAGKPLKAFYEKVEELFSNPVHYPDQIRNGKAHYHQTEILAWGSLGTEASMAELAALIQQATEAPGTELEKRRVAIFVNEVWDYMAAGRQLYVEKQAKPAPDAPLPRAQAVKVPMANGDSAQVDWTKITPLNAWVRAYGGAPADEALEARLAHDGTHIYIRLEHQVASQRLQTVKNNVYAGDDWEIFVAKQRGYPYRQMGINPQGAFSAEAYGEADGKWPSNATVISDTSRADRWTVSIAIPLANLLSGGVKPGDTFYVNFFRVMRIRWPLTVYAWSPTFGGPHTLTRLGEVVLE